MTKARDELRAARLSSPINSRLWKQKQLEFCERVADVNVKVDRLNMIVPTLYQQIARFDTVKEQVSIAKQCTEQTETEHEPQHDDSAADSNAVTFTDVLRQLKALFHTWTHSTLISFNEPAEICLVSFSECKAECILVVVMHICERCD